MEGSLRYGSCVLLFLFRLCQIVQCGSVDMQLKQRLLMSIIESNSGIFLVCFYTNEAT